MTQWTDLDEFGNSKAGKAAAEETIAIPRAVFIDESTDIDAALWQSLQTPNLPIYHPMVGMHRTINAQEAYLLAAAAGDIRLREFIMRQNRDMEALRAMLNQRDLQIARLQQKIHASIGWLLRNDDPNMPDGVSSIPSDTDGAQAERT